jgi:hypothetical protein
MIYWGQRVDRYVRLVIAGLRLFGQVIRAMEYSCKRGRREGAIEVEKEELDTGGGG